MEWGQGRDGHIGWHMLLEYSVSSEGKIHWRVLSVLALKNRLVSVLCVPDHF